MPEAATVGRAMRVLASRLRELKLRRGDQRRLAELAGVRSESLSRWKKGQGNPRLSELESLADAMHVPISYLVQLDCPGNPKLPALSDDPSEARVERLLRRAEKVARDLNEAVERQKHREPSS